jgi:hypothetical protein
LVAATLAAGRAQAEFSVKSLRALRDEGVVKQRDDYSCGSASLATLLTYGLNDPVDENALLRAILEPLSPDELKARMHAEALRLIPASLSELLQIEERQAFSAGPSFTDCRARPATCDGNSFDAPTLLRRLAEPCGESPLASLRAAA